MSEDLTPDGSVTRWIRDLKAGDETAAREIWQRYFHRLVGLARQKLKRLSYRSAAADEEDVALSAFVSLCEGAASGRFDQLGDRDDLWKLLVVITARKASDSKQSESRLKRGGGLVLNEADLHQTAQGGSESDGAVWDQVADDGPTPDFAAMLAEEYRARLDALGSEELRRVALLRMEGYSNDEIAGSLGCALRTVARRLQMIRTAWEGAA